MGVGEKSIGSSIRLELSYRNSRRENILPTFTQRKTVSMGIGILRASSSFILSPLFIESIYSRLKHRHPPSIKSPFYPAHLDYVPTKFVSGQQKLMTGHFSRTIGVNEIKLSSLRSHFQRYTVIEPDWKCLSSLQCTPLYSIYVLCGSDAYNFSTLFTVNVNG